MKRSTITAPASNTTENERSTQASSASNGYLLRSKVRKMETLNCVSQQSNPNHDTKEDVKSGDATSDVIEKPLCVVCIENEKSYACTPCGHKVLCIQCFMLYQKSERKLRYCPLCRRKATFFIKILD